MEDERRTYCKVSLEREIQPQQKRKTVVVDALQTRVVDIDMPEYQKQDMAEMPKTFFLIISGGEVREKDYFRIISHQDNFQRIKLEFIADPNKLNPLRMFELAKFKKGIFASSRSEDDESDKIYLVSDVDDFMAELIVIYPKCVIEDFQLIISNPCFELWLYYAHCCNIPDFSIPEKVEKISGKFKGWVDSAIRGGVKPKRAIFSIYPNINNAKKNYAEAENGIPLLFSTNMYVLAEDLLPLIEPELTNMIEENKRKEVRFRREK